MPNGKLGIMNKTLLTIFLLGCIQLCMAQDPSFSQFYASRIYLNPAFTGIENGISFSGASRMQWVNVDEGFKTYIASVEIQEPYLRSGFGLSLFHNTEGLMQLNTNGVSLSYAYHIPLDKHNIHIGFQGHWVQKSVDWNKITFSDQLDPVFGDINPTTAVPLLDRISYTDFDFGILWRFQKNMKIGKLLSRDTRTSIGLSIHHLPYLFIKNAGNESFQNLDTQTSPRLTLHAGTVIPLGLSYDANTTGVGPRAGGVYEIAFRWLMNGNANAKGKSRRGRSKRILDCHNFF